MKALLMTAAVLAFSAPIALAECTYHSKVSAEAEVDRSVTTASIGTDGQAAHDEVTIEKAERLPTDKALSE